MPDPPMIPIATPTLTFVGHVAQISGKLFFHLNPYSISENVRSESLSCAWQPLSTVWKPFIFALFMNVSVSVQLVPQQQGNIPYLEGLLPYCVFQLCVPMSQTGKVQVPSQPAPSAKGVSAPFDETEARRRDWARDCV